MGGVGSLVGGLSLSWLAALPSGEGVNQAWVLLGQSGATTGHHVSIHVTAGTVDAAPVHGACRDSVVILATACAPPDPGVVNPGLALIPTSAT